MSDELKTVYPHEDRMTNEMLEVLISIDALRKEIEECHSKAKAAKEASDISLPATSAKGTPVIQGTRLVIDEIVRYWVTKRDAARTVLVRIDKEADNFMESLGIDSFRYGAL